METIQTLRDIYSFPGFRARARLKPHPYDPGGRIVQLERRQKKQSVQAAARQYQDFGTGACTWSVAWMPEQPASTLHSSIGVLPARIVKP